MSADKKEDVPLEAVVAESSPAVSAGSSESLQGDKKKSKAKDALKTINDLNGDKRTWEGKVPYRDLYRYADKVDFILMFFAIIGSLAHGVSQPLFSVIMGNVINSFAPGSDISSAISESAKWFVILGAATAVVTFFQNLGFMLVAHRQVYRIRKAYFKAITRQDMAWYDAQEVGALTARIGSDMIIINEGMAERIGTLLQMVAMFIGGFIVAFIHSWKLTLVILSVMPLIVIAGAFMSRIMAAVTSKSLASYAAANAVAEEAFTAMRTVTAFSGEERTHVRFIEAVKHALVSGERKARVQGLGMAVFFFIMFNSYGLAFWYGATLVNSGELDAGTVTIVFFSVLIGSMAIGQGAPFLQFVGSARGAAYAIFKVIDRVPEIDSSDERGRKLDTVRGHIEFRNVKFTYPTRPEAPILRGLNLEIQPGQTVALVGASGCGKSTSVGLIERFYDPAEGEVLVDGVNVKELSLPWWRAQIGLVSQEPVLFARSIKENIRYGNLNVTDEEIIEAAKRANAHDFIMRLPKQYDTMVGERGGQLSGGQKQRVAIARALVRDPKVLLLDEATSALDNKSEKVVQDALDKASVGRTTIIIAHRLSTIRHADRIFVFDKGVIVEQGTHDELMTLGGLYKDLVERQQVSDKSNKDMAAEAAAAAAGEDGVKKSKSKKGKKKDKEGDGTGTLKKKKSKKTKAAEGDATPSEGASSSPASPDLEDIDAPLEEPMAVTEATKTDDKDSKQKKEWKISNGQMLKRTLMYNKPEWFLMFLGTLAACAAGAVFPLYAIIMSEMLMDLLFKRGDPLAEAAEFWALMFLALAGGTAISNYLLSAFFSIAGEHLTNRLREMLFKAYLRQDIGWFDLPEHATGVLGSKLSTDATLVQSIINTRVSILVQTVATLGAGIIIALTACWELALVVLACVPLVAVGGSIQMKAAMSFNEKSKKAYEQSSNIASECISNIRTVVSLGRMQEFYNQYHAALQVPNSSARVNAHLGGLGMGFSEFVTMAVMGLAFWYGGRLADPAITPGTTYTFANVMKAIMAIVFGAMMTGQLSTFAPDYSKARDAAESIYEAVDRVPPIDSYNTSGEVLDKLVGNIALRDVHFRYPSRPEMPVLRGLSLDIEPGKTTALVGSSGCGKSTIIQLLERFYDPLEGSVTIDGQDVRSLSLRWWRSQVGLVQQEPMLFACSIGENIRFGKPDATQAEIEAAAKLANAHNFITALPDGYNTMVGERGAQLSGGQKQRIAIARALVRNPKLLLLDEATSALDSESEQVVQEALDVARQGRTTIMIAHRLATVKNADVIVVIDQGVVIEKGTHDELLDKRGFYYSLVQSQNR